MIFCLQGRGSRRTLLPSRDGKGSRRSGCSSADRLQKSAKGKRQKFPRLRKRRNKSGSHQSQKIRMGLCESCTEEAQSPAGSRGTAETPNWGCGAQTDPAAPQGCFADDPTPIPQHSWDSLPSTSRSRASCQSPETSPQETHTPPLQLENSRANS